jgi:ankyrin repeat protein
MIELVLKHVYKEIKFASNVFSFDSNNDDDKNDEKFETFFDGVVENEKLCGFLNKKTHIDGLSALHIASRNGDFEIVALLLSFKNCVDANIEMNEDVYFAATPLHLAVQHKKAKVVEVFLKNENVDVLVELRNKNKKTISNLLLTAIDKNCTDIVKLLLNYNKDNYLPTNATNSNVSEVCDNNDDKEKSCLQNKIDNTAKIIMKKTTIDPNRGLNEGVMQSPLLFAVLKNHAYIAKQLLLAGALCNVVVASKNGNNIDNDDGKNLNYSKDVDILIDIARHKRNFDVMQVLMSFEQCQREQIFKDEK